MGEKGAMGLRGESESSFRGVSRSFRSLMISSRKERPLVGLVESRISTAASEPDSMDQMGGVVMSVSSCSTTV